MPGRFENLQNEILEFIKSEKSEEEILKHYQEQANIIRRQEDLKFLKVLIIKAQVKKQLLPQKFENIKQKEFFKYLV